MLHSRKAESFIGIIVGVFILSFVMLGIINLLIFSNNITTEYEEANRIHILKQNLTNVIKKLDTSQLKENEIFYVHKDRAANRYEIYTGTINENYKYIDEIGNTIEDIDHYEGEIYSQILWIAKKDSTFLKENQVIQIKIRKLDRGPL